MRHMNMPNERGAEQEHRPSHVSLSHMNKSRHERRVQGGRGYLVARIILPCPVSSGHWMPISTVGPLSIWLIQAW